MNRQAIIAAIKRQPRLTASLKRGRSFLSITLPRFAKNVWRAVVPPSSTYGLPRGQFSALEELEKSQAGRGRVILRDQGSPVAAASSIMVRSNLRQHQEQPWPIFWSHHSKAHLVGRSLAMRNRKGQLCLESVYYGKRLRDDPAYWHMPGRRSCRLNGNWTSIVSRWVPNDVSPNYAHWLLDALPRLAALPEFPKDTGILTPDRLPRFATETLEHMGLISRCRTTPEKDVVIENYYFSSATVMIVCYDPYAVEFLRRNFLDLAQTAVGPRRRIFVQRKGHVRAAVDTAELETFFRNRGWQICDTATLSFAEQVTLFESAEAVCGIHGAGFANCVWCRPGTKVIELFCDQYLSGCYEWLAQTVKAEHHSLVFSSDDNLNAKVDLPALKSLLGDLKL